MSRELMDEVVHTCYGQFDIVYRDTGGFDGEWPRFFSGQTNGLVGAADADGVYLNLARWGGGSRVRIELHTDAPDGDPHWEDVVEVSTTVPTDAHARWMSWGGESWGDLPDLTPGDYRVRVSAHGRDRGKADEHADGVVDSYLVQLWPAPPSPDVIVRTSSKDAQRWHDFRAGQSPPGDHDRR
jgi:hypothetical protein